MKKILIETSARHIHVNKEALEVLFGKGASLTPKKDLSQPGQFACEERVDIVGPKSTIKNVSILGPERDFVQVELSKTDARTLGVAPPIRESGDIKDSASCKIIGKEGELEIKEGVIIAKRHIHMTESDAKEFGLKNGDIVCVKTNTDERNTIFSDVVVRVSNNFSLAMHIDTDESNAANCVKEVYGDIVKI